MINTRAPDGANNNKTSGLSLFHTNWLPAPGDIAQNTLQSHSKQCRDYNGKREHDKHMINYFSFFTLLSFINSCLLN